VGPWRQDDIETIGIIIFGVSLKERQKSTLRPSRLDNALADVNAYGTNNLFYLKLLYTFLSFKSIIKIIDKPT